MKRDQARLTLDGPWLGALLSAILIAGALISACYGYALRLPFYFDDLPVLAWLGGRRLGELWTAASDNGYYRPLTFSVYKFGLLFPKGAQQVVLHGVNLLLHWIACLLVARLAQRNPSARSNARDRACAVPGARVGLLAALLYAVYPFFFRAVPWVTAMPHFLVVVLTLAAALAALRAVRDHAPGWWAASLLATALAPFAHESGLACGAIVGGLVVIQHGVRPRWRDVAGVLLGLLLNAGTILLRARVPHAGSFLPDGVNSAYENVMFALHGLVYPVGPIIGALVRERGLRDFTLVAVAAGGLAALLAGLGLRARDPSRIARDGRWIARSLWWWACGMLPAAVRFRYGGLINSPRFYALAATGVVLLWAEIIVRLADLFGSLGKAASRRVWARGLVGSLLAGALLASNVRFLWAQRGVHRAIAHVYQEILEAAEDEGNAPLGFVNVPAWLTPRDQTYALSKDGAVMLPLYTDVWQFIAVNREERQADNVMYVHTLQEPGDIWWGFHGDWLDWEQMRQFAVEHRTVWLARWEPRPGGGHFELHGVGTIVEDGPPAESPLARYEGGPLLEAASAQRAEGGRWTLTLTWYAEGPLEANVFVHVVDAGRTLVTQADGPALGGMVPLSVWQLGDRVTDVRLFTLPPDGGPYTVLVGVYNAAGRLPALSQGARPPDDAVPVAELAP